ncbi:MAG: alpha/beta fold hydrolase [Rhizobiaceae bacterium]|nr:alpha/beta fold hydrolase [Rhizobiaceae bacterium]
MRIILVHGMAANKLSWFDVPNRLNSAGYDDITFETLPGHEGKYVNPKNIFQTWLAALTDFTKFSDYVDSVVAQFPKGGEKVVLIGHSMGGQVISAVAAQYPERIEKLIYVTAFIPKDGQSIAKVMLNLGFDFEKLSEQLKPYFKNHPNVFASQSLKLFLKDFEIPTANLNAYNSLTRYYVTCSEDDVIPINSQNDMLQAAAIPPSNVGNIDTDHIPQVSKPDELMKHLEEFLG